MRTIAYLGPEHTNTHVAAQATFGRRARYLHAPTVDEVFHLVERQRADYGVAPIENSLEGAVTHTLDRFIDFVDTPVRIQGEIEQPIRHYLLVHRGASPSDIKVVFSHPQALAQCRRWLERSLPSVMQRETNSTAEAVSPLLPGVFLSLRQMAGNLNARLDRIPPRERAAIARKELATKHRLRAIPIPEERENKTRFLILGLGEPARGRRNKTSILLALKDKPGALHDALVPFKRERINLTKIESRPSKKKAWEYYFFIDVEGHVHEPRVKRALTALARSTSLLRVLGSYPTVRLAMPAIDGRARSVVRDLPAYKPGTPIDEVKRQFKLSSVIKLASNENALGPSPKALAALRKAVDDLHRYPDATCRLLKARLASKLRVDASSLIVGNGSDELIVLALRALVDPGDEVVVAQPTFLIYELQAKACGAFVRTVPLRDFRYDLPAMKAAISAHTKLVFIANPDNPTGTYVTKRELEAFLGGLPSHTVVFLDEAYYEFVEARDYPQTLAYVGDHPVVVTRSFSKAYGLAGLRVGYGIAQPSLIAAMDAVREPFNVNSLAQVAACAALDDAAFLSRTRALLREGRRYLTAQLDALKVRWIPSVANFLLLELGPGASAVAQALLERGVIVREMSAWKLPGCVRVTIGTMAENRRLIAALKQSFTR